MKYDGHTVRDVTFTHRADSMAAPVWCACGWPGTVREFPQHRLDAPSRRVATRSEAQEFAFGAIRRRPA